MIRPYILEHKRTLDKDNIRDFVDLVLAEIDKTQDPNSGFHGEKGIYFLQKINNSMTCKNSPNVNKSCPKRMALVKWKILLPLQKLPKICWQFRQNNCCPGLWKVAQSIINRQIWSHWSRTNSCTLQGGRGGGHLCGHHQGQLNTANRYKRFSSKSWPCNILKWKKSVIDYMGLVE